jgi:hypothetical protein
MWLGTLEIPELYPGRASARSDLSAIFLHYTSKISKKDRQGIEIITQLPLLTNVIDLPNVPVL